MSLYMYIALGQGQKTLWGQKVDVNRNSLSLCPFVASLKSDFLRFFMCDIFFFHMYIAPGRDRQPIGDKNLWHQKGLFSLPICCKFQNELFEIWFYTHF